MELRAILFKKNGHAVPFDFDEDTYTVFALNLERDLNDAMKSCYKRYILVGNLVVDIEEYDHVQPYDGTVAETEIVEDYDGDEFVEENNESFEMESESKLPLFQRMMSKIGYYKLS